MQAIEVKHLVKVFGSVRAVDDVDLDVDEGEVFGLLGPNGAGKTTIVRILSTLILPTRGSVRIYGFDVVREPDRVKPLIGVAPQEINLDMELTPYENLLIHGMLHGLRDVKKRVRELLSWAELDGRAGDVVRDLSGGMKRRLLIARAIMHKPKILILDEPTVGLDPQIRRDIWDIIKELKRKGVTIILTTHYIEEADILCDRVGIMSRGKLVAVGKPSELKEALGNFVVEYMSEGKTKFSFFKTRSEAVEFVKTTKGDAIVRSVSLEDVFIKLTGERIEF